MGFVGFDLLSLSLAFISLFSVGYGGGKRERGSGVFLGARKYYM